MSYFNLIETDGLFRSAEEIANYKNKDGELIQPAAQAVSYTHLSLLEVQLAITSDKTK